MARKQKRPSPLEEPPTASSSDSEEEQQPSSQQHEEEASSEEEEEDEEEEDHQPSPPLQSASTNPTPQPTNSHPKPSSSESATESDSETESEAEPDPPAPAANPKVKPLASKPMEQNPKEKAKAKATSSAAAARSGLKRPADNNMHVAAADPKRAKKKLAALDFDEDVEEDGKKKLFQRIYSEEDEFAILKGVSDFTSKTGMDPLKNSDEFYEFVKKGLHVDASSNQLKQKVRRLKKKFDTNVKKGKNGEDPKLNKAHEQKLFELSKKVWGNGEGGVANGAVDKAKPSKKEPSSRNVVSPKKSKPEPEPKPEPSVPLLDFKESEKMDIDKKFDTKLTLSEMVRFGKGGSMSGLNEDVVKRGLELMEASKREELEGRWKKLQVAELELFVKRAQLIEDQARLILEVYKSSNN